MEENFKNVLDKIKYIWYLNNSKHSILLTQRDFYYALKLFLLTCIIGKFIEIYLLKTLKLLHIGILGHTRTQLVCEKGCFSVVSLTFYIKWMNKI